MTEREVSRGEDMTFRGKLALIQQEDGDIIVAVRGEARHGLSNQGDVEFCEPGAGGGASPETHKALMHLMEAMTADNERRLAKPSERAGVPVDAIRWILQNAHRSTTANDPTYGAYVDVVRAWLDGYKLREF
jgi:hypothetical protein